MKRTIPFFYAALAADNTGTDPTLERTIREKADFWREGAALYRGVPLRDLTGEGEGTLPYLLCREEQALAAFQVGDGEALPVPPGLLALRFQSGRLEETVAFLEQLLRGKPTGRWRYAPEPVPDALRPELERNRLIQRDGEGYVPGGFGAELGLTLGYRGADGPTLRLFWSAETRETVEKLLTDWHSPPLQRPAPRRPWKDRLAAAQAGLIDPGHGQKTIRALAELPLGTYLADFPQELKDLNWALRLPEDATYRQAACQINELLCSSGETDQETGRRAMLSLAQPLWFDDRANRKGGL